MPSLKDINFLQKVLYGLNAEKPAGTGGQGQTIRQERGSDLIKRLQLEAFSQEGRARVIVTGQIGVGKSSELWHFFRQRINQKQKTGFWVYCDLEKNEHPERCGANGVLLTILRDCWGATKGLKNTLRHKSPSIKNDFFRIREELTERLIDWLKGEKKENGKIVTFNFGGMDFPVQLTDKDSALALILGKAAQHEAVSVKSERFGLVADRLVNLINNLFKWLKSIHFNCPPLLIIDHIDKIRDEASAREVLVDVIPQWQRIDASIVITAPYEYTLGDMRNSVESYWGRPLMVYPLDFPERNSESIPEIYHEILRSCGLANNIDFNSIRILAHFSGGIPRTFIQFLVQASKEAHLSNSDNIEVAHAQSVVFSAERAYQDYGSEEIKLLKEISEKNVGLSSSSTLLRSPIGLLVLPPEKGHHPLRVHPLAESLLERYYRINN